MSDLFEWTKTSQCVHGYVRKRTGRVVHTVVERETSFWAIDNDPKQQYLTLAQAKHQVELMTYDWARLYG